MAKSPIALNWLHRLLSLYKPMLGAILLSLLATSPGRSQTIAFCRLSPEAIASKESLRQSALSGDSNAQQQYNQILIQHAQAVYRCRQQSRPQNQALWLRLYSCDAQPGAIEKLLDDIINKGYNQVYLEVFYDGQVLLPAANNPTPWPSVMRSPGLEQVDLLAQTIEKGRQRGLQVYAWMFMLNFGYTYTLLPNRAGVLAVNGSGETTVTANLDGTASNDFGESYINQGFVDPYNPTARQDFNTLLNAVLSRRPSGVLFDYVRYPRGLGPQSVASRVKDLWIYGDASLSALLQRANNDRGRELLQRYVSQGFVTENDVNQINQKYPEPTEPTPAEPQEPEPQEPEPQEKPPLWHDETALPALSGIPSLGNTFNQQLWRLSVAHAQQGILDFLNMFSQPVQSRGIPAGAVFFPEANRRVGEQGFDSRLQPWDRFPSAIEWHPMAYGVCGTTSCIVEQVETVANQAQPGTKIIPAIAGDWGKSIKNRPPLEHQMRDIINAIPQIQSISHYSYDWQEPQLTRDRQSCR
ncbi:MAG: family 10 glycosylhydrolase [Limnospira sp. PMC 737.11]|uniref:Family 10 glycosylhydrolase n=1 Tax=Limnospira fusiformis PMC 851.14 TaxID=2219512 RepID=A0ABU9EQ66_LIMFS|nr:MULTISPECIES: family 10 glycosylhydrolase [unclassified Limnospira]MDT9232369.1 family 10 glycosylhydrolase [Limnospira sp. PMC 917.15]MDT9273095.1 family 10 glycosylhydrolase [Limnospira sp. PMC 737.11]